MIGKKLNRRTWFRATAAASAGAFVGVRDAQAIDYSKPVPEAEGLTAYVNGGQALFRWNNLLLTAYRAQSTQKYPYFCPMAGPVSGLSLTAESALPYPHHRGLWLGLDPLDGGNYWAANPVEKGQIVSQGIELKETATRSATIVDRCDWVRTGVPSPLGDERRFTVSMVSDRLWTIDAEIKLTARQDIVIGKAKHSFFALRAAADISPIYGGVLENSEGGRGAKATFGKTAKWCGYFGKRRQQPGVVEGITIMDHPGNPWAPTPWFTRDYGHLSPSPFSFREEPWRLAEGRSIDLRYLAVAHAGNPRDAELDQVYENWIR